MGRDIRRSKIFSEMFNLKGVVIVSSTNRNDVFVSSRVQMGSHFGYISESRSPWLEHPSETAYCYTISYAYQTPFDSFEIWFLSVARASEVSTAGPILVPSQSCNLFQFFNSACVLQLYLFTNICHSLLIDTRINSTICLKKNSYPKSMN